MSQFIHVAKITISLLWEGFQVTFIVSFVSILLAILLGVFLCLMCLAENKVLRAIGRAYIKIFRCTPFMVQVYLIYYGLPEFGINVSALQTGIIILSMYTAAYIAVILESGIKAIPKGQSEAAYAMGMSRKATLLRIIFPQTISVIIPSLTGQLIQTVKDSSILSVITVVEMTMMTKEAIGLTFDSLNVYIITAVFYWIINLMIEAGSKKVENRYKKHLI